MNKEIKDLDERLQKVNSIISKLDPAIKSLAFELFKSFILNGVLMTGEVLNSTTKVEEDKNLQTTLKGDVRDFYASFNPKSPADSALVLTGWIYTQQGSLSFTLDKLRELFDEVGVSCPARLDMTLKGCQRKGKPLFQNAGHGSYRPTVYGENHFKAEMNLRPGKQPK